MFRMILRVSREILTGLRKILRDPIEILTGLMRILRDPVPILADVGGCRRFCQTSRPSAAAGLRMPCDQTAKAVE